MSVSRRNEEVLDLVEDFADGKGMSRSDSLFYLSGECLIRLPRQKEVRNGIDKSRCHLWSGWSMTH